MNELFGLSMTTIMLVLLVLLGVCLAAFLGVLVSNRTMFRIGLRNLGRRRSQTSLIVSGLMLATVIITAAFTTGDVIDYSITKTAYDVLQRTDLSIHHFQWVDEAIEDGYVDEAITGELEDYFADDPDIEGFMPFLYVPVAFNNPGTRLSEPSVILAGFDATRLEKLGGLRLVNGRQFDIAALGRDEVLVGERTADRTDTRVGDTISVYTRVGETQLRVAGIVRDERAAGTLEFDSLNAAVRLETAQAITGYPGKITTINVALGGGVRGGLRRTEEAASRLDAFEADEAAKAAAGIAGSRFQVERVKQDVVDDAKLASSMFTTMFLVLGLFSIAAGAMLIFTLFVMLAAERRTEMGITRAVGAQRSHLVQSFVSEGMVYDLIAGGVGVVLGVLAAFILVVGGARYVVGGELSFISAHVTARSLVVSFCLGAVLTFITVAISAVQVSRLNIVAAVRGQGEAAEPTFRARHRRLLWLVPGVPLLLVVTPLGLYLIFRRALGMSWSAITGPGGIALGLLFLVLAYPSGLAFFATGSISLFILSGAVTLRSTGLPARPTWSGAGGLLAIYWLLPEGVPIPPGEFEGNIEMFVLSGIMIVTGFTLLIVFNARLLTAAFASQRHGTARYLTPALLAAFGIATVLIATFAGDAGEGAGQLLYLVGGFLGLFALLSVAAARMPRFAPALKMGIAYPLASRFRTGMTIAMFSLVIFSITVMGIINASFWAVFSSEAGRGGWDVWAGTNPSNPVSDIRAALLAEGSFDPTVITAVGRVTSFDNEEQQARVPGKEWSDYPIIAGDPGMWRTAEMKLEARATGYENDRAVYDALVGTEPVAIVDSSVLQAAFAGGSLALRVDVDIVDEEFEPFQLEIGDKVSGRTLTVTVIGILSGKIPGNIFFGIYTNETAYEQILGEPDYHQIFIRLAPGTDAERAAKGMKAALVTQGVQAVSLEKAINEALATGQGFLRIFQAFMALGLFVGIASLGVIALRSVVERRQQIGMLRAIGYQRGTVALSFILESGFIALAGILSGLVGAGLLSWNLLNADYFAVSGIAFYIPWIEVLAYTLLAFLFALTMTWWPSRRAASVPVAEALRYE